MSGSARQPRQLVRDRAFFPLCSLASLVAALFAPFRLVYRLGYDVLLVAASIAAASHLRHKKISAGSSPAPKHRSARKG